MTIFKKIIDKEIPADIVHEDELCLVFRDIKPQAPIHLLIIPKQEIASIQDVKQSDRELMGHLLAVVPKIAKSEGIHENGYRLVINCREHGGQDVNHLHIHVLGGRQMKWPPG